MKRLMIILALIGVLTFAGYSVMVSRQESCQPTLKLSYTLENYDAQGKLISKVNAPSKSYVQGFLDCFWPNVTHNSNLFSIKDTSNTLRSLTWYNNSNGIYWFEANAGIGNAAFGIVAGTGTNAVTESDYAMQTLIAAGSGAGQMNYSGVTFTAPVTVGSVTSFTLSRTLTNNSGGSITINEIGIYQGCYYTNTTLGYFCTVRDVLGGGQAVASTHNLAITYTIAITN